MLCVTCQADVGRGAVYDSTVSLADESPALSQSTNERPYHVAWCGNSVQFYVELRPVGSCRAKRHSKAALARAGELTVVEMVHYYSPRLSTAL